MFTYKRFFCCAILAPLFFHSALLSEETIKNDSTVKYIGDLRNEKNGESIAVYLIRTMDKALLASIKSALDNPKPDARLIQEISILLNEILCLGEYQLAVEICCGRHSQVSAYLVEIAQRTLSPADFLDFMKLWEPAGRKDIEGFPEEQKNLLLIRIKIWTELSKEILNLCQETPTTPQKKFCHALVNRKSLFCQQPIFRYAFEHRDDELMRKELMVSFQKLYSIVKTGHNLDADDFIYKEMPYAILQIIKALIAARSAPELLSISDHCQPVAKSIEEACYLFPPSRSTNDFIRLMGEKSKQEELADSCKSIYPIKQDALADVIKCKDLYQKGDTSLKTISTLASFYVSLAAEYEYFDQPKEALSARNFSIGLYSKIPDIAKSDSLFDRALARMQCGDYIGSDDDFLDLEKNKRDSYRQQREPVEEKIKDTLANLPLN